MKFAGKAMGSLDHLDMANSNILPASIISLLKSWGSSRIWVGHMHKAKMVFHNSQSTDQRALHTAIHCGTLRFNCQSTRLLWATPVPTLAAPLQQRSMCLSLDKHTVRPNFEHICQL